MSSLSLSLSCAEISCFCAIFSLYLVSSIHVFCVRKLFWSAVFVLKFACEALSWSLCQELTYLIDLWDFSGRCLCYRYVIWMETQKTAEKFCDYICADSVIVSILCSLFERALTRERHQLVRPQPNLRVTESRAVAHNSGLHNYSLIIMSN